MPRRVTEKWPACHHSPSSRYGNFLRAPRAQNEVLKAALALQAEPTNDLKRTALAVALEDPALRQNDVGGAIAKALAARRSTNLIPLLNAARKARRGGADHFVDVDKGKARVEEMKKAERTGTETQKARLHPDGRRLNP